MSKKGLNNHLSPDGCKKVRTISFVKALLLSDS